MDGPSGGGTDNRGGDGVWQGRKYDATHQIKQFLGVPTEDDEKPVVECGVRSPPQNIPHHRQDQPINNHHLDRSGSPLNRHHRWDNHRYHDNKHRGDGYGSPNRNHPRLYDQNRTPPHRYHEIRQRHDSYGSPGNHRVGSYDRGYSNSPRNHHHLRDMSKDHKELRANGPRHMNTSMVGHSGGAPDAEAPDYPPSPEVLAELEEQFLYPLKKKSLKFPKAKYFCRLCDYHCDSLAVCRKHIMDNRHRKLKETKDTDTSLKNMPLPSEAQIAVIDKLVRSVAEEMRVSPDMMNKRREVVTQLNKLLVSKVEGCHLEMVGSSLSGFCLKNSNINVDVVMDDNLNPSTALLAVKELVGRNALYKNVLDDLSSSFPTMAFTHVKTGLRVVVGAWNTSSSKLTNQLFADYASLDPRVLVLGIAFRYWAQLCQIDNQGRGTLPPHVFPLMVIHFLQQHNPPLLPVLHSLHPKPDGESYLKPADLGDSWKAGRNTQSIGRLWLEMFRFYAVGFKITEYVINVRQRRPMTRAEKTWSKKIAVEDPFIQKRNLTRTVSGNLVFEYIVDRFKTTYRYFAIPQLSFGPLFQHIAVKEVAQSQSEGSSECELEKTDDDVDVTVEGEEFDDDEDRGSLSGCEQDLSLMAIEDASIDDTPVTPSTNGIDVQEEELDLNLDKITTPFTLVTPSQAAKLMQQVQDNHVDFKFKGHFFNDGVDPPLICGSCQKEGHCKADCREDELPPLKPLPPMKSSFINQLTTIFEKLTRDFEPRREEIEERDRIVADLQFYIRQFFQGVTLKLFGSSANGFGFQHSDLDICLTFDGNPTGEDIDHIKVIEALAEKLKKYRQCGHVIAITTAKVPIVKFSIRRASLEGDLSLYNTLALQNTKLLATYAKIDHRVKCLGYGMKYFAKLCDIGDASRGSLSSYAYILMVLHFLQQCKPPVIPVLQELYDHSKPAPELIIDGRNAWFFDDLESLPKVWKDYNKNKLSVGELWVSILKYYTETFNWKEHVVTIRQHAPLTRLQKLWNSRCIVIEDPFDLSHNLGAGLSRKMNTFIMKAFIRGREVFGTPVSFPQGYRSLVDYLFDTKLLTDGAPPNDRGCRCCGKIGHIIKDCPRKKLNMERREKKDRHKEHHDQQRVQSESKKEEKEEIKKLDLQKLDHKQMQEIRTSEISRRKDGSGGNAHATSLDAEGISPFRLPNKRHGNSSKSRVSKNIRIKESYGGENTTTPSHYADARASDKVKKTDGNIGEKEVKVNKNEAKVGKYGGFRGDLVLRIIVPDELYINHDMQWSSSWQYQKLGDDIFGMQKFSPEEREILNDGKGLLLALPGMSSDAHMWVINLEKSAKSVIQGILLYQNKSNAFYRFIKDHFMKAFASGSGIFMKICDLASSSCEEGAEDDSFTQMSFSSPLENTDAYKLKRAKRKKQRRYLNKLKRCLEEGDESLPQGCRHQDNDTSSTKEIITIGYPHGIPTKGTYSRSLALSSNAQPSERLKLQKSSIHNLGKKTSSTHDGAYSQLLEEKKLPDSNIKNSKKKRRKKKKFTLGKELNDEVVRKESVGGVRRELL